MSSSLYQKLQNNKFVCTVEINPPSDHNFAKVLEEVNKYGEEVDAIDLTDCAFARVRISPIALGHLIQHHCQKEVIFNYTCRDRNIIALKSELLGALALGLKNILCIRGDDPSAGDHPDAKPVFNVDSLGLISLASRLKINNDLTFAVAAATSVDLSENNLQKLAAKIKAGAHFFITQPVYSLAEIDQAAQIQEKTKKPVILGILPFKSYVTAKRLSQVPGINIPENILKQAEKIPAENFQQFSVEMLKPLIKKAKEKLAGLHLMPLGESWKVKELIASF